MPRLPQVSAREAVAAFERIGFAVVRQRGSHIVMTKPGHPATLSVPEHRVVKPGTLRALIRQSGLTVEQFVDLLH
jgi:predicted RNA binding protein YcfA (HicA-like mRNA interferase family)